MLQLLQDNVPKLGAKLCPQVSPGEKGTTKSDPRTCKSLPHSSACTKLSTCMVMHIPKCVKGYLERERCGDHTDVQLASLTLLYIASFFYLWQAINSYAAGLMLTSQPTLPRRPRYAMKQLPQDTFFLPLCVKFHILLPRRYKSSYAPGCYLASPWAGPSALCSGRTGAATAFQWESNSSCHIWSYSQIKLVFSCIEKSSVREVFIHEQ